MRYGWRMTRMLKTRRLSARPIHPEDWPLIHTIQSDVEHGVWVRGPYTPASLDRSKRIARRFAAAWDGGYGPYLWELNGQPIGYAGFQPTQLLGTNAAEALWGFVSRVHRQGFASEAMQAVLRQARPDVERVMTWTLPDNVASRSLMKKLGFLYQHDLDHGNLRHVLYRLEA